MELGKNIVKLRKDNNLTQDELAEKLFVTRQTVSNWETCKNYPDLETIVKISDEFNIPLDELLKEDKKLLKEIDNNVKGAKKYRNIIKFIVVILCLLLFICYKAVMLYKYQYNEIEFDTNKIFNETITIDRNSEYNGKRIYLGRISFADYFDNYADVRNEYNTKVKYDNNNKAVAFYSVRKEKQYVNILSNESLENGFNSLDGELVTTSNNTLKYLYDHGVRNDIALLKYIKENYYFQSNIFTFTKTMKTNYLLNNFVDNGLLSFNNIVLINGYIDGYIINKNIKEIHILKDGMQYIISLYGDEITTNEFITKLLYSIKVS